MRDDDDLPVLSAVVRGGDADVIRASRLDANLSRNAFRIGGGPLFASDELAPAEPAPDGLGPHHRAPCGPGSRDLVPRAVDDGRWTAAPQRRAGGVRIEIGGDRPADVGTGRDLDDTLPLPREPGARLSPAALDELVEEIVERHVTAFRRDVRDALERALGRTDG